MTALLYVLLLLVAVLVVAFVWLWRRVRRLGRQADALRQGPDGVRVQMRKHAGTDHRSRLVVIADRPATESGELMKAQAAEWGWQI
ncbi:hypothetical protein QNO09_02820 [Streptomyces sp. 378]|uniref:hypothetical protein n=1 Tax=Streptomyces sp. 378 TaxID=3049412 RepID=UPI0024C22F1D|nr:hypothetical protein [Streptomyces sp. 378]MDK1342263.1 hypothetical protein [Streptomyces sp. 378]